MDPMYICICKGITEEMVSKALQRHGNAQDAMKHLGVGSDCGICVLDAINNMQSAAKQAPRQEHAACSNPHKQK
jgi:bacterioferritin-associated ferredoxin